MKSMLVTNGSYCTIREKWAETTFECLKHSYIESQPVSILRCTPHTGRFHQIRKHLASLHHPIINDPLYHRNWKLFSKVSMIYSCIGKTTMWSPLIHPSSSSSSSPSSSTTLLPCLKKEETLMAIDLFACQYRFPSLGLDIEVPYSLWPEWAQIE